MKIFSVPQIQDADKYTIMNEPIASIDLMERAANACVNWITQKFDSSITISVFCGLGNNGGDGLAIARLLSDLNYKVNVYIIRYSEKESPDFKLNFKRLVENKKANITDITEETFLSFTDRVGEVFVDAILGYGLNKPIDGLIERVVGVINQSPATVVAIDISTGLFADKLNSATDEIINADYTLTFQFPKLSFMFPETAVCVGEFTVLDIGIHHQYMRDESTKNYFTTKQDVASFFKHRSKVAHKGTFGHALIIAGSYGKIGAAILSSKAALKSGVGLLTTHIPECGYNSLQTALPEAMVSVDSEPKFIGDNIHTEKYHAVGVGAGIGQEKQTQNLLKLIIQNTTAPIVFDADAINCIAENKTWLSFIPAGSIFTPHPKEFERLVEKASNSEERLQLQRNFSMRYNVYVVLKGAHTSIATPDGTIYFNSTGNPGMATAGTGDVLTGIITSLLAQGYPSLHATILGVYLHGLAGDFAVLNESEETLVASDIVEHLADAFNFIKN